ncbi:PDZ domain-containing protein [Candidatus Peregrinibacteria bacterium]|nr:PDZ domain-containing protein [Candidatus Peregrinibacteria bacterium]
MTLSQNIGNIYYWFFKKNQLILKHLKILCMKIKNLLSKSLFSVFLLGALSPFAQAATINDVLINDQQYEAIEDLIDNNAITLDQLGNFRPNDPINKVEFIKAAFTYLGFEPEGRLNNTTGFMDVPENSWFAPYVKRALEARIINNDEETFNPGESINRQEALLMALPIYGIPTPFSQPEEDELFTDIRPTRIFSYVFKAAKTNNISFIEDENRFVPSKILTRADAAELLFKTKLASSNLNSQGGVFIESQPVKPIEISDSLENNPSFSNFVDTWNRINTYYIDKDDLDKTELIYGAISGMVEKIDDPYSSFATPEDIYNSFIYIPQNYEGIGAIIEFIEGEYIIQTTINNSPAQRAGLLSGDVIIEINGKNIQNLEEENVFELIQGKAGTTVTFKVKRNLELLNFQITREKIDLKSIHGEIIENDILYIRIDQFTENSLNEFKNTIETLEYKNYSKLILDLRNNPGGYLDSTREIMNYFLQKGETEFFTIDSDKIKREFNSKGPGTLRDYEIIVLINSGSASAAEILAGALQDHGIATVIGETTFGKGSVQELTEYDDQSVLKLTVGKWLTPNQNDISGSGIAPDIEIKLDITKQRTGEDNQLEEAIRRL